MIHLFVELHRSEAYNALQAENDLLRQEVQSLKKTVSTLESRFGYEVMLNSELVDLCNQYHVPFREHLDYSRHKF